MRQSTRRKGIERPSLSNEYLDQQLEWEQAIDTATDSLSVIQTELQKLVPALRQLHIIANKYKQHWERFRAHSSPSGNRLEKVEAILSLPLDQFKHLGKVIENGQFFVDYCAGSELPKGYGRDTR